MTTPWTLGMNTCGPPDEPRLQTLIDLGFKCVYLDGNSLERECLSESYAAVQKRAGDLVPWSIHLPILFGGWDMDEAATRERLFRLIEEIAPYHVQNGTLHLPCYSRMSPGGMDLALARPHREAVMRILREGAARADSLGIRLNVENCGMHGQAEPAGYCLATARDVAAFMAHLDCEEVGFCLDTGHAMLAGQDPAKMIRELGGLLSETHFNDNFGVLPNREPMECDFHRPPGIGKIDWLDVMDALEQIRYPNPVVFEEGMVQVGGDTFEFLARATYDNWCAFERVRAKRDGEDPSALGA